jgi:nucleoside-diphosphate-sugar epimerase
LNKSQFKILNHELESISNWANSLGLQLPERILVTGASGFLGQWVFASLLELAKDKPRVQVLCETRDYLKVQQTWLPEGSANLRNVDGSKKFDLIFDLALPETGASIAQQVDQAKNFYSNISKNFKRLLPGGRLIHPSSGAVYGDQRFSEILCEKLSVPPINLTVYGEAKLGIERLADSFRLNGLELLTPRIFSVFGPLMREDSPLIGNVFIRQASKGDDIFSEKSRNVFRDFTYVTDIVMQLIHLGVFGSRLSNLNLGSGNIAEVSSFGSLIARYSNVQFFEGNRAELADNYFGCLHELRTIQAWTQTSCISLTEAVQKSVDFYVGIE